MIPKLNFCNQLPEWIRSSDKAAYHPASNTIFVVKKMNYLEIILSLIHEIIHVIAHRLGGSTHWLHKIVDRGKINYI